MWQYRDSYVKEKIEKIFPPISSSSSWKRASESSWRIFFGTTISEWDWGWRTRAKRGKKIRNSIILMENIGDGKFVPCLSYCRRSIFFIISRVLHSSFFSLFLHPKLLFIIIPPYFSSSSMKLKTLRSLLQDAQSWGHRVGF